MSVFYPTGASMSSDPWSSPASNPWGGAGSAQSGTGSLFDSSFNSHSSNGTSHATGNNIDEAFDVLGTRMSPAKTSGGGETGQGLDIFDPFAGTLLLPLKYCAILRCMELCAWWTAALPDLRVCVFLCQFVMPRPCIFRFWLLLLLTLYCKSSFIPPLRRRWHKAVHPLFWCLSENFARP